MKIGFYGAGSIGCYIGGRMVAAGHQVTFYCRERSYQKLSQNGLELSDLNGYHHKLTPDQLRLTTNLAEVLDMDLVMICVKSAATEQVASEIRSCDTLNKPRLISFQNGVSNVPRLKKSCQNGKLWKEWFHLMSQNSNRLISIKVLMEH